MNIFKQNPIEGRPFFTNKADMPDRTDESILKENPLLNRLKPVKNPSRVVAFFRRFWAHLSQYFGVKHPDSVKESLKNLVRPLESSTLSFNLTIGNLWHHYEHFLSEDKKCPPGLKSCFDKMEHDEKELLKISRTPKKNLDKAKTKFIKKTIKGVKKMQVGSTRLFVLQRAHSNDQSVSGDLFCTISHTKDGYVLSFMGSGDNMDALQKGIPLAGKEKAARTLSFEPIDADTFKQDGGFLTDLATQWVEPQGVDPKTILESTQNFTQKVPSLLEEYTTKSNRPDKLFWNIVLAIPQENSKNTLEAAIPASIRSIRLRAELLTLYEAFDEARIDLDPKTRQYKDLSRLLENVSGKVLLHYRKGYLSDVDFNSITKRLKIIDDTLGKAKQEPNKTISSSISIENHAFPDVSLKKMRIEPPQNISSQPTDFNTASLSHATLINEELAISLDQPISLKSNTPIYTKYEFFKKLTGIHSLLNPIKNGKPEEQNFS
ncbi:MAG: hypothetical protein ACHQHP_06445, partial [Bacteroidia bacterium]